MNIGEKLKQLRLANDLTQEELATRCDLSKGFISLIERDLSSPSIVILSSVLDALGTTISEFFNDVPDEKIIYPADEVFVSVDDTKKSTISWLVNNAQKFDMEPIIATVEPGGEAIHDKPHEGQEFGYVLAGRIALDINQRKYTAKKGESFYYYANTDHRIYNPYKTTAKVLLVSTPPSF